MANKKKNTNEPSTEIEETVSTELELEGQETTPPVDESVAEQEQDSPTTDETESSEPVTEEMHCPFEATVAVALAVLRKSVEPGTAEMLKPVATLKRGTKIAIVDIHGSNARLANGLWIALEYITR